MLIAYKGFNKDLSCTSGGNRFDYKLGVFNTTEKANCRENGFHCAENPLDCLSYYPDWSKAVYYIVLVDGDIHEDATDTKISCTRMKLVKQLQLDAFIAHSLNYISEHPLRENNKRVSVDKDEARGGFAIVRGKNPMAMGQIGDILGFAKEELGSTEISEIGLHVVDGKSILPNVWYDVSGSACERQVLEG